MVELIIAIKYGGRFKITVEFMVSEISIGRNSEIKMSVRNILLELWWWYAVITCRDYIFIPIVGLHCISCCAKN